MLVVASCCACRFPHRLRGSELALLRMRWRLQLPAPLADDGLAQREALGGASAFGLRGWCHGALEIIKKSGGVPGF